MKSLVVWIDHENAKIFRFEVGGVKRDAVHAAHHAHHARNADAAKLFHDVATYLGDATEILVVGPGTAKSQFLHHLETHHHEKIFKKVVGTETCDHPTDNQLVALARKFFTKEHLFA
jgi:stalled ribosome rescue protein Dom34